MEGNFWNFVWQDHLAMHPQAMHLVPRLITNLQANTNESAVECLRQLYIYIYIYMQLRMYLIDVDFLSPFI